MHDFFHKRKDFLIFFCSSLIFLWMYFPVISYPPFTWDDRELILENPAVIQKNFLKILTLPYTGNYMPVTMSVIALLYSLQKNILVLRGFILMLHWINTWLLFRILKKESLHPLARYASVIVFLVHPLQTESLCWISELKTSLCCFFMLTALIAFTNENKNLKNYIAVFLLFVLSILSKPVAVVFPVAAWWMIQRKRKLYREEKIFLMITLCISVLFSGLTWYIQHREGYVSEYIRMPFVYRIPFAAYLTAHYFFNLLFPFHVSVFYPYPEKLITPIAAGMGIILFFIFLFVYLKKRKNTQPLYLFIMSLIMLVPTLQVIPFGEAMMADRYAYLFIPWATAFFWDGILHTNKKIFVILLVIWLGVLMYFLHDRIRLWSDPVLIFSDAVKKYPKAYLAENSLGVEYLQRGMNELAETHILNAISHAPYSQKLKYNLALVWVKNGETERARKWLKKNTSLLNPYPKSLTLWAELENLKGNHATAEKLIQYSLRLRPDIARSWYVLGNICSASGKPQQAISAYEKAISLLPDIPEFYFRLGMVWCQRANYTQGISCFNQAIRLDPQNGEYFFWRAEALKKSGKNPCKDYLTAYRLKYPPATEIFKKGICGN